jgi:hypothetical protein
MVAQAPADATLGPRSYSGFDEYVRTRGAVTRALGGSYLAPNAELSYSVPLHGRTDVFVAAPSWRTHVLDLAVPAATAVFDAVTLGYANCILDSVARSEPASFADAPGLVVECFPLLAQATSIGKFYLKYIRPTMNFVKTILQAYDLAHDAILQVHGAVRVSRPSLPLPDFYYANAVQPETLYSSPAYPKELAIDNHDWIAIRSLNAWSPEGMIMTGILNHDECQPDCAAGPNIKIPVRVVATNPRICALQTFQSGSTLPARAYVYSKVSVTVLSGNPPSDEVGDSVFKVCS